MAGDSDFAAAAFAYTSNFFHDGARGVGQLGRTGRKRTASANSYDNLVFLTVDVNEPLADFLPQGDLQLVLGDLRLFIGLSLLFLCRVFLGGLLAVVLDCGFGSGGKLR